MITAKEAVEIAVKYYQEVTSSYALPVVEEVDMSDDDKAWLITLGIERADKGNAVSTLYGNVKIIYKVFSIDAENGNVLSMKIRE